MVSIGSLSLSKSHRPTPQFDANVLIEAARPLYANADPAHDFSHILRVYRNAKRIGKKEGARMEVLLPAALLHDCGCVAKLLGRSGDSNKRSLVIAREFLKRFGFSGRLIKEILYAIEVHGFSKGIIPETLEAKVLQDADRLDAIGAVGIARVFAVSGARGRPFYEERDPFCSDREPDDASFALDHFYRKLLKLDLGMHTETGRRMARKRTLVLKRYLKDLETEIGP